MLSRFPTATRRRLSGSFFLPRSQAENSGRAQTPCQARPPPRADSYRPGRRIQGLTLKSRKHRGFGMKCPTLVPPQDLCTCPPPGHLSPLPHSPSRGSSLLGPLHTVPRTWPCSARIYTLMELPAHYLSPGCTVSSQKVEVPLAHL